MLRDDAADQRMAETPALLQYLPRILVYPLRGHGFPALLMFWGMLWLGLQSVFGVAMLAIASPWLFAYAEAVIDQSANGRATPPQFGGDMIYIGGLRAMRPLIGVALIVGAWVITRERGIGAQVAVLAFGALLFPAFMLLLTVENSIAAALNPFQLLPAMIGVGPVYFVLCVILAGAAALAGFAVGQATLGGALLVSIYLWLMTFHLLGYVAFHRADRLGLKLRKAPPTDDSRRMERQQEQLASILRAVDAALTARDLDAAARAVLADPGVLADVRLFHEELFEQLQVASRRRPELIHLQGQRLIAVLLPAKRLQRALDIAETCFDAHLDFVAAQPEHTVMLAGGALQAHREGLFERLQRSAARHYGEAAPAAVSMAFLRARFLCEQKRDEVRAREVLQPLLVQTAHPQHRQIVAYAKALGLNPVSTPSAEPRGRT